MSKFRGIDGVFRGAPFHMVGDGFRVTNYFPSGNRLERRMSPFILMDYHPPFEYPPTDRPRGVGTHPHRGFETVTLAYEGSVAHHDSAGNSGVIGPGDVQWMTAGSGVLHQEYHEKAFARSGGVMHMMQLWVNLPKIHKMTPPKYQSIGKEQIGLVNLPDQGGEVRVIAGEFQGVKGPASTFTPINLFNIRLNRNGEVRLALPKTYNTAVLVLEGTIRINDEKDAAERDLVLFMNEEGEIVLKGTSDTVSVLLLNGEPIDEPMIQYGPFVMNNLQEIHQAIEDFDAGRFGQMDPK